MAEVLCDVENTWISQKYEIKLYFSYTLLIF